MPIVYHVAFKLIRFLSYYDYYVALNTQARLMTNCVRHCTHTVASP